MNDERWWASYVWWNDKNLLTKQPNWVAPYSTVFLAIVAHSVCTQMHSKLHVDVACVVYFKVTVEILQLWFAVVSKTCCGSLGRLARCPAHYSSWNIKWRYKILFWCFQTNKLIFDTVLCIAKYNAMLMILLGTSPLNPLISVNMLDDSLHFTFFLWQTRTLTNSPARMEQARESDCSWSMIRWRLVCHGNILQSRMCKNWQRESWERWEIQWLYLLTIPNTIKEGESHRIQAARRGGTDLYSIFILYRLFI